MKWISVQDQLPSKNQWIIAYGILHDYIPDKKECDDTDCTDREITVVKYDSDYSYNVLWFFQGHCCETGLYHVTHWMPLPEKPI